MKLGMLGAKKAPSKRFKVLPVLTVSHKRVECCGIVAECPFFSLVRPTATDLGKMDNTCAGNNDQSIYISIYKSKAKDAHRSYR